MHLPENPENPENPDAVGGRWAWALPRSPAHVCVAKRAAAKGLRHGRGVDPTDHDAYDGAWGFSKPRDLLWGGSLWEIVPS